jgi:hypothetical protein
MEESKEENICSICNEVAQSKTATFVCKHIFCQPCIVSWYFTCVNNHREPTCPVCRKVDNIWGKR